MIEIKELSKSFGEKSIFSKFNLNINDGEFVIFSGESGCGKTTLLNMIGGIEDFNEGDINVNGTSLKNKRNQIEFFQTKVGFLFQNFALIENKTVKENLNIIKKKCRTNIKVEDALEKVGLSNKLNQKVYTLSGGEQQRIALARLMLKRCDIILADEPTGSLDKRNAEIVLNILNDFNKEGKTIILVTHDESIRLKGSRVVEL